MLWIQFIALTKSQGYILIFLNNDSTGKKLIVIFFQVKYMQQNKLVTHKYFIQTFSDVVKWATCTLKIEHKRKPKKKMLLIVESPEKNCYLFLHNNYENVTSKNKDLTRKFTNLDRSKICCFQYQQPWLKYVFLMQKDKD